MKNLVEGKFGHGGRKDFHDDRDYKWANIGKAAAPFNWSEGYDIEVILRKALNNPNYKLPVNNQGASFSCGGQAWSKYGEGLDIIYNGDASSKSAKFIYAQTFQPGGGSYGRDNCKIVVNKGWGNESDVPSTENGNPPSEAFIEKVSDISQVAFQNAKKDEALSYAQTGTSIDSVAQAIRENYGAVIGIYGQDNGTWLNVSPLPPSNQNPNEIWAHWVYAGKAKMINGKKAIGILNSWGEDVGDGGWQWITEDYFNTKVINGSTAIYSGWTMVFNATPEQIAGKDPNWLKDLIRRLFSVFGLSTN